jgi:AraC family transcriptional regulator, transcriptional activator of pobA
MNELFKELEENRAGLWYNDTDMADMINRIDYKNSERDSDFEIIDLQHFFATRPHTLLQKDVRMNFWAILYITEGKGHHYVDLIRYSYKKGDILFIQKNQIHRFEINDEVEGYIIHVNEPFFYRIKGFNGEVFLDFIDKAYGVPVLPFDTSADSTNRALVNLLYKEYCCIAGKFNIELIASLFDSFMLTLKSQLSIDEKIFLSKDYENFKVFRQLVEENYSNTKNVEDYSVMMNLSRKTINQASRNVAGLSAKQFIINRIILEIKRFLCLGNLLNYEIADQLGFDEPANMTKFFMHYEGISPKEFRKNIHP